MFAAAMFPCWKTFALILGAPYAATSQMSLLWSSSHWSLNVCRHKAWRLMLRVPSHKTHEALISQCLIVSHHWRWKINEWASLSQHREAGRGGFYPSMWQQFLLLPWRESAACFPFEPSEPSSIWTVNFTASLAAGSAFGQGVCVNSSQWFEPTVRTHTHTHTDVSTQKCGQSLTVSVHTHTHV